ncbi:MAG: fatty acid desaturase [Spirochaetia bacterium]|nr:fatty acid desaturase [Spirochaetia bacterium]
MGIFIASTVILAWAGHLVWTLSLDSVEFSSVMVYIHILVQAYLYTGLFITAHDSMHGSVARNRKVNDAFGQLALWLFAAFRYRPMFKKHMKHHHYSGTAEDPDFSVKSQHPIRWFFHFFFNYVTVVQLITMAALFNIGRYVFGIPLVNLIVFWVVPAFLATFQLFYFGTYRPHRLPHTPSMEPHNARTQEKNHLWAMVSCWFFGYHWEHHEFPRMPWWRLYSTKNHPEGP